jgi:hypothetical protein
MLMQTHVATNRCRAQYLALYGGARTAETEDPHSGECKIHGKDGSSGSLASSPQQITSKGCRRHPIGGSGPLARLLANRRLTIRYDRRADILQAFLHVPTRSSAPAGSNRCESTATSVSAFGRPPTPGRMRLGPARAALPRRHPATA